MRAFEVQMVLESTKPVWGCEAASVLNKVPKDATSALARPLGSIVNLPIYTCLS